MNVPDTPEHIKLLNFNKHEKKETVWKLAKDCGNWLLCTHFVVSDNINKYFLPKKRIGPQFMNVLFRCRLKGVHSLHVS